MMMGVHDDDGDDTRHRRPLRRIAENRDTRRARPSADAAAFADFQFRFARGISGVAGGFGAGVR